MNDQQTQTLTEHFDNKDFMPETPPAPTPKKRERPSATAKAPAKPIPSRYLLQINMSEYTGELALLKEALKKVNAKNIGKEITMELLLARLINKINDDFILNLQKESLSEEEINLIFKTHLSTSTIQ